MKSSIRFAVLAASFLSSIISVSAANLCDATLALLDQPGFQADISEISKIKAYGIFNLHKIVVLQRPETNQVVVLLGEAHVKKLDDTKTVAAFVKRFKDIAVELVERGDRKKQEEWAARSSSNIARSLLLDSPDHRVHLIDKELPAILNPYNVMLVGMSAMTFYIGYADVTMFTSNGSAEVWLHKLAAPPPGISLPITTAMTGIFLYSLDGFLGTVAHLINTFKVGDYMPLTRHLLNKRNVFMTQKIANLMNDKETQRENMLVIVGRMHMPQMIVEMKKHGFHEVDTSFLKAQQH